jgi:hypothetical protein
MTFYGRETSAATEAVTVIHQADGCVQGGGGLRSRRFRLGFSGTGSEGKCSSKDGRGLVYQGAGVAGEAFGGLVAGEGDLCREEGGGLVGSTMDEQVAELVRD